MYSNFDSVTATAVVALATAASSVEANSLTVPANRTPQRPSSSDSSEWQDIRELLVFTSSAGLKPGGSSDPGSPNSVGGVREKKSSSAGGGGGILPRFLHNSSFRGDKSSSSQLRPPGSAVKTSPVQIQLQLLPGSRTTEEKNAHQKQRRHSLER